MNIQRSGRKSNMSFTCPECGNKTAYCIDHDVHIPADVDYHDKFVCEECGAELYSEPQHNGKIKFKVGMENIESSTVPARDIEVVAKAAADVRGYDDLLKVLSSLKLIDEDLWKDAQLAWSSKEYSPAALGKMISDELYWQHLSDDVESCDSVNCRSSINLSDYTYVGNQDGYAIYRKIEKQSDGSRRGVWVAQDQDGVDPPFSITYDQARGFEPIDDSAAKKLGKKLGEKLLPNSCVKADTESLSEEYEDDIQEISQEFTSENTSINSSKLPAIFKMISLEPGTINIDYGGGRFDNVADYLTQFDVINLVYDPYNRTPEHNREVIRTVKDAGGADTATCSNVLNVIKEPEVRMNVLQNIRKLVKPSGTVYITVYEGTGKGDEGPTKSGYQLNRKTADYLEEIQQVFPDAVRKGKLIVAHPQGSVQSATEVNSETPIVPEPYNLYFEVEDTDPGDYDYEVGEQLDGYGCRLVAYLVPKPEYDDKIDVYPVLTDDAEFPVCDLVGGRLYPVDIDEIASRLDDEDDEYLDDEDDDYVDSAAEIDPEALANMESVVEAAKSVNVDSLQERIYQEAKKVMMSPEFGFPEDEVDDYLVVEVRDGDETTCVEVRAEVSYEGMSEMADRLNKIVQRYDPDAYFDHVTYGIIEAYIRKKSVQSSYMYPDFTCYRLEWITNDGNRKRDEVYAFDSDDAKDKIRELYDNDVKQFMHVWKETRDSWIECASEVEGADYGGAYDIEPDQYFTKDDVMEFASLVTDELSSKIGVPFDIADAYMENPKLMSITVTDGESEFTTSIKIDMRKIYYPKDLMKFSKQAVEDIQSQYNAYYEDVTSATNSSNIQGGWNDVPDPPLDPPESDVYDLDNVDEYLEIEIDDEVVVNDDGSWDFVGDDPRPWALDGEDSHWSSETYTGIELTDATGLEENCMDLLESRIPGDPGNYKIHAKVTLCYIISGLQAEPSRFEEDDPEVYSDYAEVEFSNRDSKVEDFEFEEV